MRAARAVGLVSAGLLALGLAQAPTTASTAAGTSSYDGPTVAELRAVAATLGRDGRPTNAGRGASSRRVDVVTDPLGDARSHASARRPRPYTRLADLTRARFRTPVRRGGTLRITTRWADHVDASRKGVRRQYAATFLTEPGSNRDWVVQVSNVDDRVSILRFDQGADETRVRPESVAVDRTFGPNGTTDLFLSTEWLDARRVSFSTTSFAGEFEAFDDLRSSRVLDVGAAR